MTLKKWWSDYKQFLPGFRQNVRDGYWLLAAWFTVTFALVLVGDPDGPRHPVSRLGGWLLARTPLPKGMVVTEDDLAWMEGLRAETLEENP